MLVKMFQLRNQKIVVKLLEIDECDEVTIEKIYDPLNKYRETCKGAVICYKFLSLFVQIMIPLCPKQRFFNFSKYLDYLNKIK